MDCTYLRPNRTDADAPHATRFTAARAYPACALQKRWINFIENRVGRQQAPFQAVANGITATRTAVVVASDAQNSTIIVRRRSKLLTSDIF
jgi:hypothetical protein